MTTTPTSAPDPSLEVDAETEAVARTTPFAILAIVVVFFVPLAGIIVGQLALAQTKRTGQPGRRLALVATVLGYSFTALIIVVLIVVSVIPLFAHSAVPTYSEY